MFALLLFTDVAAVDAIDAANPDVSSTDLVAIEPNRVPKIRFKLGICYRFVAIELKLKIIR